MKIRILVVDDHKIVRDGLRSLLEKQADVEVVAEASNGRDAVRLAHEARPHVVIMDIGMPDMNGIEAARRIAGKPAGVRVVALSMYSDRRLVGEMLRAGASAFVLKDCAFAELVDAVRSVMAGRTYLSSKIVGVVVENYVRRGGVGDTSATSVLTDRQREVVQLISEGLTTPQVAERLHISARTVETYRKQIMDRLGVRSIAEVTKYAIREGLTFLDR